MKMKIFGIFALFLMPFVAVGPVLNVSADGYYAIMVRPVRPAGLLGQLIGNEEIPIKRDVEVWGEKVSGPDGFDYVEGIWSSDYQCYVLYASAKEDRASFTFNVFARYNGVTQSEESVKVNSTHTTADVKIEFDLGPIAKNKLPVFAFLTNFPLFERLLKF